MEERNLTKLLDLCLEDLINEEMELNLVKLDELCEEASNEED